MNTETLEEAAVLSSAVHFERTICSDGFYKTYQTGFKEGAEWMQERMYSEQDMKLAFEAGYKKGFSGYPNTENWKELPFDEWFKNIKK